jgi:ATP-dependent helicase/nuclease subunit A
LRLRRDAPGLFGECLVWADGESRLVPAIKAARDAIRDAETAESYRLLYVAMTRARDRLYITGFENRTKRGRDVGCWYDVVRAALEREAQSVRDAEGCDILRLETHGLSPVAAQDGASDFRPMQPPPAWLDAPAPQEAVPSTARPSAKGDALSSGPARAGATPAAARLRGEVIHLLLERLPALPCEQRRSEAERLAASAAMAAGIEVEGPSSGDMIAEALAILDDPGFAHLFGAGSRAEVSIAASTPDAGGAETRISGRIDRLVVRDADILVIDYKTDRVAPETPEAAPGAYIAQLAAYGAALQRVFPGKQVRAFILWTSAPRLMEIPQGLLGNCDWRP